jgi:arabinofuranosyltransferase
VRTTTLPVEATSPPRHRSWSAREDLGWAVVGLSALVHLALCWLLRGFSTDDAWISVRCAEDLAAGEGCVWDPGGPRGEGFSNPVLVAVEALADAVCWYRLAHVASGRGAGCSHHLMVVRR